MPTPSQLSKGLLPAVPRMAASSHHLPHLLRTIFPLLLLCLATLVLADCECGYLALVNDTSSSYLSDTDSNSNYVLFTNLLETDFTRLSTNRPKNNNDHNDNDYYDMTQHPDWAPQAFNHTREHARGDYGEMFAVSNVVVEREDAAGVQLVVRSEMVDGMVPVAELDTRRLDVLWGTFRASMKVSAVKGVCAAFFWYFNDTQEIDMEFLTTSFHAPNKTFPINLVLQSRQSLLEGHDASHTPTFITTNLPFDPTTAFHEYRIDYLSNRVIFYADGVPLATMSGPAVPSSAGHLILQNWSNGNRHWSGGPPEEDAVLMVRYVKAYFNSSSPVQQQQCSDPAAPYAVCRIPDVTPGNGSAAGWFFTEQGGGGKGNQSTSEESGGLKLGGPWWVAKLGWVAVVLVGGWVVLL